MLVRIIALGIIGFGAFAAYDEFYGNGFQLGAGGSLNSAFGYVGNAAGSIVEGAAGAVGGLLN